jgi:putative ABC transport system permease protein
MRATLSRFRVFALRDFRTHWRRAVASMLVVAVSCALLVAILGIFGSLTTSVDRMSKALAGNADLEVAGVTDGGFDESVYEQVAAVPGVGHAAPMLRAELPTGSDPVTLLGVDETMVRLDSDVARAVQAGLTAAGTPELDGVVAGAGSGFVAGQKITLGAVATRVVATVDGPLAQQISGGDFVVVPLELAQRATQRPGRVDSVLVVTAADADVQTVRAALSAAVSGRALVSDSGFRAASANGSVATLRYSMLATATVTLIVAGFLVFSATNMALAQRTPTISMLRALGARRSAIVVDVVAEAALAGLIGALIGVPIGLAIGVWAMDLLPSMLVQSVPARLEYAPPGYVVPLAVLVCVLVTVLAAAVAARRVYRVQPIEALAPTESGAVDPTGQRGRVLVGLVGVGIVVTACAVVLGVPGRIAIAGVSLYLTGAITVCFALRGPLVAVVARIARRFGAPGRLAAESARRTPQRVWASVMTLAVSVAMVTTITGASKNLEDSATASFAPVADNALYVSSTPVGLNPTGAVLPANTAAVITAIPGVAAVVPGQWSYATVDGTKLIVQGIADNSRSALEAAMRPETRRALLAGEGVVLSRDLSRALGVQAGGTLELPTPTGERAVPVLEVVSYFSGVEGAMGLGLTELQQWYEQPGASFYQIRLDDGADSDTVAGLLRKALPQSMFVSSGKQALDGMTDPLRQALKLVQAMQWVVAILAMVALLNMLMLSVIDRARELGVLRAIGTTRRFARRVVLAEAAAIGIVGAAIGFVIGAVGHFLDARAFGAVLTMDVTYRPSVLAVGLALAAALIGWIGAIPPARRAARINLVEAVTAR